MIDVIKIPNGLPISVIVPLQEKRNYFFYQFVLPLLISNNPSEIIINSNEGGAGQKRNEGFKSSSCPLIFFSDDDILLPKDYFNTLYINLDNSSGYVYTGYNGIVLHAETNEAKNNFILDTVDFNPEIFKERNFISTMSLMKRDVFPYFDESLSRFIDYDLYLNLLSRGIKGKAVHGLKFYAFYLDEGITSLNNESNYVKIKNKYKDLFPK